MELKNVYLVWLEWPEKCFRADAEALRYLRTAVPKGSRVLRTRSEAAFLKALPQATHAITWHFKSDWFAKASRLKVLATPAAGQEFVPTKGPKGVKIHFGHYHGEIMSESVLGFMLCWARGFFRPELKKGAWPRTALSDKCYDVAGTKAVIVGYGNVGRAIGAKLAALGVDVYGLTRHGLYHNHSIIRSFDHFFRGLACYGAPLDDGYGRLPQCEADPQAAAEMRCHQCRARQRGR